MKSRVSHPLWGFLFILLEIVPGRPVCAREQISVAAEPIANPTGKSFPSDGPPLSVTLTCATAGADIYYTLDGSMPSAASTRYSGPIQISATTTLRAIATKTGYYASTVMTQVYQSVNAGVTLHQGYGEELIWMDGRLGGTWLQEHRPVSITVFDALGVFLGAGKPVGNGAWELPHGAGPIWVEFAMPDGACFRRSLGWSR